MNNSLSFKLVLVIGFFLVVEAQSSNSSTAPHWSYHEIKGWIEHYSGCGGAHQSPIDLKFATAQKVPYPRFKFGNYRKTMSELVTNNGHTVQFKLVNIPTWKLPFITGGGLEGRYIFEQMHFHWGANSRRGSEHLLNGIRFPAELHMVHYNAKYGNFTAAVPHEDGLAVLGIFIQLGNRDNPAFRHLEQFQGIQNPSGKNNTISFPVPLSSLLPVRNDTFYRYNGSLTTPGCNEDVIWTVFNTPITISERQLNKFRRLRDDEGKPLVDNFRPAQELHDRVVTYRPRDSIRGVDPELFIPLPSISNIPAPGIGPSPVSLFGTHIPSIAGDSTQGVDPVLPSSYGTHPSIAGDSNLAAAPSPMPWFNRYFIPYIAPPNLFEYFQWAQQMQLYLKPALSEKAN